MKKCPKCKQMTLVYKSLSCATYVCENKECNHIVYQCARKTDEQCNKDLCEYFKMSEEERIKYSTMV